MDTAENKKYNTISDLGMKLRVAYNHDRAFIDKIIPYKNYIDGIYATSNFNVFPSSGALIRDDINWDTYDEELAEVMKYLGAAGIKVYLLVNGTNFSPDVIKDYRKSELRKYLKKMVEKNGLEKVVIFSLPLGLKIKEDFPHVGLEVSTNAYIDSLEKAKYWAEYGKVEGICVHQRLNKRIDELKKIKEQTGLKIAVIANDICLVNCPNEICHNNFCSYKGNSRTFFGCENITSEKPWYTFHQAKIVPANMKYYKGIVDTIKLEGRAELTDQMVKQVKHYAIELDSYAYPSNCLRTEYPFYPFCHPYMLGNEPPDVFEKVSKCSTDCENCGYCYKRWKEYYDLGGGIDYFISGYKKFNKNEYREAIPEFEKYINFNYKVNDEVYYFIGLCYEETSEYGKAVGAFNKYIAGSCEKDGYLYYHLGLCYKEIRDYPDAVRALEKSVELSPFFWEYYNMLGFLYRETGQDLAAIEALKQAIKLNPDEWRNYNVLGHTYVKINAIKEGLEMLEKAFNLCDDENYKNNIKIKIASLKK